MDEPIQREVLPAICSTRYRIQKLQQRSLRIGNPLGPFTLLKHNPFSYKPEGFVNGTGHGSTFQDLYGNYWNIGTSTISRRHMFERRISLYPTFFDKDGDVYAYTAWGDYPMIVPDKKYLLHKIYSRDGCSCLIKRR